MSVSPQALLIGGSFETECSNLFSAAFEWPPLGHVVVPAMKKTA
jgi:hypothetical protein